MSMMLVISTKTLKQKMAIGVSFGYGIHTAACNALLSLFGSLESCLMGVGESGVTANMTLMIDPVLVGDEQPSYPYSV